MQSECITPQLKELQQLKLSPSTKSATADRFITKKPPQKAVLKAKQKQLVKSKVPSINYPYFAKIFIFFVVKLKLLRKSSDVSLLGGCG